MSHPESHDEQMSGKLPPKVSKATGNSAGGISQKPTGRGPFQRLTDFVTSLNGLLTALCATLTLVATLLGFKTHQQASQISDQQLHITIQASQIAQQQVRIKSLGQQASQAAVAAAPEVPASTPTGADTATPPAPGGQTEFLSSVNPVNGNNEYYGTGPALLSAVNYPNSIRFQCSSAYDATSTYPISGFRQMTAMIGVPDDASNATGAKLAVSFTDQDNHQVGSTVTVSIDHPQQVTIPLSGEAQITVHCTGTYPANHGGTTTLALGEATLTQ